VDGVFVSGEDKNNLEMRSKIERLGRIVTNVGVIRKNNRKIHWTLSRPARIIS
jgi:hypothetical protein